MNVKSLELAHKAVSIKMDLIIAHVLKDFFLIITISHAIQSVPTCHLFIQQKI